MPPGSALDLKSIQDVIAPIDLDSLKRLLDLSNELLVVEIVYRVNSKDARDASLRHKQQARLQTRRPLAAVLIDGDGYIFQALMDTGQGLEQAGASAATQLEGVIRDRLRKQDMGHCDIVVHVYANVSGLSQLVAKAGRCGSERRALGPFVAGLNRNNCNFDFVDAGDRKENADTKMKANFDMYAENVHCQRIYFAGCHDSGYTSTFTSQANQRDKIILLRHLEYHHHFKDLGFDVEDIDEIFFSGQQVVGRIGHARFDSLSRQAACHRHGHAIFGNLDDHVLSERRVSARLQKEDIPKGMVAVDVRNQRLDPSLSPPNKAQLARWNGLYRNWGLCKEFHLVGCCRYERCKFKHGSASEEAKYLLEYTSRSTPCPGGRGCRYVKCVRGHVCQKRECVSIGGTQFCKLPKEAHGSGSYRFVECVGEADGAVTLVAEGLNTWSGGKKGVNIVRHDEGQDSRVTLPQGDQSNCGSD